MCNCGKNRLPRTTPPKKQNVKQQPAVPQRQVPQGFNWQIYKELNPDLTRVGFRLEQQVMSHWHTYGHRENRKYIITQLTPDFDWNNYKALNPDLIFDQQVDYELHWIRTGKNANRQYK